MIFTHSLTPFQSLPLKHSPLSILLLQWTATSHPGLVGINAVRHAERVLKEEPDPVPIPRQAGVENLVKVAMKNFWNVTVNLVQVRTPETANRHKCLFRFYFNGTRRLSKRSVYQAFINMS